MKDPAGTDPPPGAVAAVSVVRVRQGQRATAPVADEVAAEAPLELRVGGKPLTVIMRTPGHDEELARGFLYSEGIIGAADQLRAIRRPERLVGDERGNVLDLELAPGRAAPSQERLFYASSSCGVCGKNSISSLAVSAPVIDAPLRIAHALLASLPARLREAQPSFARTGGLHGAGLFDGDGRLLGAFEDVGRHNALDKLIGWALLEGWLPWSDKAVVVSGRIGYEVLQKTLAAGAPILAAVGAPSSLAVDLAEQFGITLAGFVHEGSMNLYAHPERVA